MAGRNTTVTVFPPRPFFSTRSFATIRAGIAAATSRRVLHWQFRCGHPHTGHLPAVAVEYTTRALGLPLITSSSASRALASRLAIQRE